MAAQTLGIIDFYWGGIKLDAEPGGEVTLGGVRNKPVIYGRRVAYASEMTQSEVSVTVPVEQGKSVLALIGTGPAEMQAHCDTGQVFTWNDAFLEGAPSFSGHEGGKLKLKLVAGEPQELMT